jgi:hypothetical protein
MRIDEPARPVLAPGAAGSVRMRPLRRALDRHEFLARALAEQGDDLLVLGAARILGLERFLALLP